MCGITGAAWRGGQAPLALELLERMTEVLVHRGPDDAGYYHSVFAPRGAARLKEMAAANEQGVSSPVGAAPGAALGFRRLSIIDLEGGHQPLSNEDDTLWIVFNGEIYNYIELARDLAGRGHRFKTHSDTEVILHLYEELGPRCVEQLRGMFAFAIWDDRRGQLFLARDRLGKKPLVYRLEPGRLLFASELKSLLQDASIERVLAPESLDAYLAYQYVPHPQSILRGFSKLPPAHWAVYADGEFETCCYWRPPGVDGEAETADAALATPEAAGAALRETLTEAVRLRMRSDVPLGAFLSGGVDSTIITGLMQRLAQRPVETFSIGFAVPEFDERSFARQAAAHLGTNHHELVVEPEALSILPKLVWHYDEPFADSSAIPTFYLAEMTRRHVTVALSGDGGDELFAGYDRYRAVALGGWFDRLPAAVRKFLGSRVWQWIPASTRQKSRRRRLKRLLEAIQYPPGPRYLKWISIFDDQRRPGLYTEEFRQALGGHRAAAFLEHAYKRCGQADAVAQTACVDLLTYLPCDILTKVDIASMAHSLEVRCPFLDHHVVELSGRLPIGWKFDGRTGKKILLAAFADLIPPPVARRAKMGFGVPLDCWFRNELKTLLCDVLLDQKCLARGIFSPQAVRRLIEDHLANRWDHSYRLWALLVLELWQQRFIDH
jgi:asparagine synthase (glutamine-hydrolysing)